MSKSFKIYTVGAMSGLSYDETMIWRNEIEDLISTKTWAVVDFVHPPKFYNYFEKNHHSEKEIKDWETSQVRDSDILIVNLTNINHSVGAHFELAVADSVNSFGSKHIYIIGVGESKEPLHPWIELSLHRKEESFEDAAEYITNYLLV